MTHSEKCMCKSCIKKSPQRECWACKGLKKGVLTSVPCSVCGETTTAITTTPQIKNLHLIEAIYRSPGNVKGSRVQLTSHRFKETIYIPYNYSLDDIVAMAEEYLISQGHKVIGHCETKRGYGILCEPNIDHMFSKLKDPKQFA